MGADRKDQAAWIATNRRWHNNGVKERKIDDINGIVTAVVLGLFIVVFIIPILGGAIWEGVTRLKETMQETRARRNTPTQ